MQKRHVAFIVESAHGHLNPTLGIASLLVSRGYRVTYPVNEYFAPKVMEAGAEAVIYHPLGNKFKIFEEIQNNWDDITNVTDARETLFREEQEDTLAQLEALYQADRPDLVIYDVGPYLAGHSLAVKWGIRGIRYVPAAEELPSEESIDDVCCRHDDPALVLTPKFFCRNADVFDNCNQYHFVGPIYNDKNLFKPWKASNALSKTILVSATTGLVPQIDFFKIAIRAFENSSYQIVLSVGDDINPSLFAPLAINFEINQYSSQLEILKHSCLFIGQGGPASTLEALYCGVPAVLIPPTPYHKAFAVRAAELGLGVCMEKSQVSAENLRNVADHLLEDTEILNRVRRVKTIMRENDGAERALNLIEELILRSQQDGIISVCLY